MNKEWTDFLIQQSAKPVGDAFEFENAAPDPGCALNDLSHLGLIAVSGEDAESFLQGQFTCDVRELGDNNTRLGGFCNPKGRMLSNFLIYRHDGSYFLQMPLAQIEATLKRLRMYVLRAKVTVDDVSGDYARIGITGSCAAEILKNLEIEVPKETWKLVDTKEVTVINLPGREPRFEVVGRVDQLKAIWLESTGTATPVNPDFWALQDIRAGIPTVYPENAESFVPQMTNMQLINGVSFTKGCYTGQEVVARMQYLGKLKRRMYLAHVSEGERPEPGTDIYSGSSTSGQGAGKIVEATPSPEGGFDLLAVMEISSAEAGDIRLGSETGAKLELQPLPYAFTDPTAGGSQQ